MSAPVMMSLTPATSAERRRERMEAAEWLIDKWRTSGPLKKLATATFFAVTRDKGVAARRRYDRESGSHDGHSARPLMLERLGKAGPKVQLCDGGPAPAKDVRKQLR